MTGLEGHQNFYFFPSFNHWLDERHDGRSRAAAAPGKTLLDDVERVKWKSLPGKGKFEQSRGGNTLLSLRSGLFAWTGLSTTATVLWSVAISYSCWLDSASYPASSSSLSLGFWLAVCDHGGLRRHLSSAILTASEDLGQNCCNLVKTCTQSLAQKTVIALTKRTRNAGQFGGKFFFFRFEVCLQNQCLCLIYFLTV